MYVFIYLFILMSGLVLHNTVLYSAMFNIKTDYEFLH